MTVQEIVNQRTEKLLEIKNNVNEALSGKGVSPVGSLYDLPSAIESIIQSGEVLPELTDPADVSHVIAGKEYIDGAGMKRVGTLVVCDTVEESETVAESGVGLHVDLESTADRSSKTLTIPEQNLLPENIKNGVSIFGISGRAKTLSKEIGTITPATNLTTLTIPCSASPKMIVVKLSDESINSVISENISAIIKSIGSYEVVRSGNDDNTERYYYTLNNVHKTTSLSLLAYNLILSPNVKVYSNSTYPFLAGYEYNWTAYYWEDD